MKARNINGTSDHKCKCSSWLKHWETFSDETAGLCVEKSCTSSAEVGAHVQKEGVDQHWYIIPLCTAHNNKKGQTIDLYGSPTFVSANVSETCG
jgi:hypothetical protein